MEGPPLGPGGEDITWPDQVAPRGRKASSTRKIKPQTSNLNLAPGENPRTSTLVTLCRQKYSQRQPTSQLKLSAHHDGPNGDLLASKGAVPDDLQSVERGNGNILELF